MADKKMSKRTPHCDVRGKKTGKSCPNKATGSAGQEV